jgi:CheY-like chemotaxis protein
MTDFENFRVFVGRILQQMSQISSQVSGLSSALSQVVQENVILRQEIRSLRAAGACSAALIEPKAFLHPTTIVHEDLFVAAPDLTAPVFPEDIFKPLDNWNQVPVDSTSSVGSSSDHLNSPLVLSLNEPSFALDEPFNFYTRTGEQAVEFSPVHPPLSIPFLASKRKTLRRLSGPIKILVVEDDLLCQQLLKHLLASIGLPPGSVQMVQDGVEAVINMSTASYDLVLMDMQLPTLDGLSATQKIRKFNRRTPIVSMTARVGKEDVEKYIQGGIDDVLPKPFDSKSLIHVIEHFYKLSLDADNDSPVTRKRPNVAIKEIS